LIFKGAIMNKNTSGLLLIILAIFITVHPAICEKHVSGSVYGTWTVEDGPYFADAALSVLQPDTLIIEPGVTVLFQGRYGLIISGILIAEGEEDDSIFFHANNHQPDTWIGLEFNSMRSSYSRLAYCSIKYAYRGIVFDGANPSVVNSSLTYHENAGLRLEDSRATITDCDVSNINGSGIAILESSRPVIQGCTISRCQNNGISVSGASGPRIIENIIRDVTDVGINLSEAENCSLRSNQIILNELQGIRINQSDDVVLLRNIIYQCGSEGAYIYRSEGITLLNNTIKENSGTGIYVYTSSAEITSNIVDRNDQDGIFAQGANPQLAYNCVYGNERDNYSGVQAGMDDIDEDPALDGDFIPMEGSPVIDTGDPRYRDLDGTRSDIGARFFNQNQPPEIISTSPEPFDELEGDQSVEFIVYAEDPDNHPLTFTWYLNNEQVGDENSVEILFNRDGDYVVRIVVDDGYYMGQTIYEWSFRAVGMLVPDDGRTLPGVFTLSEPYPNPFNSTARIEMTIGRTELVNLSVNDLNGRQILTVWEGTLRPGRYGYTIDGKALPAGSYIIAAQVGGEQFECKITLIK